MDLLEGIYTRVSVRQYTDRPVEREHLRKIIEAGMRAPSGLNNQPWRFVIVRDGAVKQQLAKQTKYDYIIDRAPACIVVFIDRNAMYHEVKDYQAIGACIQNMLLAAHGLGLGAVWLGEILRNAEEVRNLLDVPDSVALMAVVALGHPTSSQSHRFSNRKDISEVLLKEL